jgi:hypothetical protein
MPTLTLSADKPTYRADEPIRITVALTNNDSDPLTVNKRLALNTPYAPSKFREIKLTITDEAGETLPFAAKVNLGFPLDKDFVSLAAGEPVERKFDLRGYFRFDKAGRYRLEAVYQNGSDPSEGEAWKGEVGSEAVEVIVS